MLFHEIYGSYFNAVAAVLSEAAAGTLTGRKMTDIVQKAAFGESLLSIPAALKEQRWPLLERNFSTPLRHTPTMPLTGLQLQWLKALLQDPRIRLFAPDETGLEEVEPLYAPDAFVFFDRYADGDPFTDAHYIACFRIILQALREKRKIRVRYRGQRETERCYDCVPYRLEYSSKDDKFRLIASRRGSTLTVKVSRILSVTLLEPYTAEELRPAEGRESFLILELTDERNALERVMLHFSDLEKETEKLDERHYRVTLRYRREDETEILIRILSFGPVLKVLEPAALVEQIRKRLARQRRLLGSENAAEQ